MKIFGLDFTSVPSKRKAITYAQCSMDGDNLALQSFGHLTSFNEFETFLAQPGPWVMGMDFPFGQPRKLIENLGWPATWEGYVRHVAEMSKSQFVEALAKYRAGRLKGDKQHLRRTDELANSRSPMMLYGVPVGKMFFRSIGWSALRYPGWLAVHTTGAELRHPCRLRSHGGLDR